MISSMEFEMEMTLDDGSTDGKSLEDVENDISETFKPIIQALNPFADGNTTVDVNVQLVDVCASADEIDNEASVGEECDSEAGSRRKRRFSWMIKRARAALKATVSAANTEDSTGSILSSSRLQQSLSDRIVQAIKDLGSHAEHLSDEQLCDHASKATGTGISYISKAISSSANFMKMKPVQTKKPPSASTRKFYLFKWMDSLPENIKKLPLTMLAIPGTHQSGTSALQRKLVSNRTNSWSGDGEIPIFLKQTNRKWEAFDEVQTFYATDQHLGLFNDDYKVGDPEHELIYLEAWSVCQRSSINDQLVMGIRYFDFRLDLKHKILTNLINF